MGHFYRVLKHILPIACAEVKSPKDRDHTWIEVEHSTFVTGLLTLFFDYFVDVVLGFFYKFLDFYWLDTTVSNEVFKGNTCYLPTSG
jgi:hypothetical protein